jgi:hypothetical protein
MFSSTINNRELATYIWLGIIFLLLFLSPKIRKPLLGVLKMFLDKKILLLLFMMISYVTITIFALHKVHFWDASLFKDSIVWLIGVGFIMLMNAHKSLSDEYHFKESIKENIKLTIIVEFLINLYVFNLPVELILLPGITFLVLMQLVSERDKKYEIVTKFTSTTLSIIGWGMILFVSYKLYKDFKGFTTMSNLKSFLLPVFLTITYMPFVYFISLFMLYETFFVRINMAYRHNKALGRYAKFRVVLAGGLSLSKARMLSKELHIFAINTRRELDEAFAERRSWRW